MAIVPELSKWCYFNSYSVMSVLTCLHHHCREAATVDFGLDLEMLSSMYFAIVGPIKFDSLLSKPYQYNYLLKYQIELRVGKQKKFKIINLWIKFRGQKWWCVRMSEKLFWRFGEGDRRTWVGTWIKNTVKNQSGREFYIMTNSISRCVWEP